MTDVLDDDELTPIFAQPAERLVGKRTRIPDDEMLPETAYQIVHDETMLDGNARLNLATFVTTWMDDYANRLYTETVRQEHDRQGRVPAARPRSRTSCWRMLADLWNAPDATDADRHLHHRIVRGVHARRAGASNAAGSTPAGPPGRPPSGPNLVMSAAVQVVLGEVLQLLGRRAAATCRSAATTPYSTGTIWSPTSTRTPSGWSRSWASPTRVLRAGPEIAAHSTRSRPRPASTSRSTSTAPPARWSRRSCSPTSSWDFRLTRVHSINTSGHKYGLVYPGLGWVVWRDSAVRCRTISCFEVSYLGGDMPTFALNFSRPGRPGAAAVLPVPPARPQRLPPGAAGLARMSPRYLSHGIGEIGRVRSRGATAPTSRSSRGS